MPDQLVDAVKQLGAVATKNSKKILWDKILFSADKERGLAMSAVSDKDMTLVIHNLSVDVEEEGYVVLSAGKLLTILETQTAEMTMTTDANFAVTFLCGTSRVMISGKNAKKFPDLKKWDNVGGFDSVIIESGPLARIIADVEHAVSRDPNPIAFNSLCLHPSGRGSVSAVGTDNYRLAISEYLPKEEFYHLIAQHRPQIPLRFVSNVLRFLQVYPIVSVYVEDGFLYLSAGFSTLSIRLSSEEYPDYLNKIPTADEIGCIPFNRSSLIYVLTRLKDITDQNEVTINVNKNNVFISSDQAKMMAGDVVRFEEDICDEPISVSLNAIYLLDALRVIKSDIISMKFYASNGIICVIEAGSQGFYFTALIMPCIQLS